MKVEVQEFETADYDIIENIVTALYRLWKLKLYVVLVTLVGLLITILYVSFIGVRTSYVSSASIYSVVYGSYSDSSYGVTAMNMYSGLLDSSRVCARAAANMSDGQITSQTIKSLMSAGKIYLAGASSNSRSLGYKLTLVTRLDSPQYSIELTNAVAHAFADEVNDLLGDSSLQVMDEATFFYETKTMNVRLLLPLAALISCFGSAFVIFAKEFFSTRVYSVAQCEQRKELVLGILPYQEK